MMRTFNTAGKCIPSMHYMVDISRQVDVAAKMVSLGNYFCINRGRQYGKTTTLAMLKKKLEGEGYAVFSLSFEGLSDEAFKSYESLLYSSAMLMLDCVRWGEVPTLSDASKNILENMVQGQEKSIDSFAYSQAISLMSQHDRIVLLIDEVDAAGNHIEFINFLGLLRDMYLKRDSRPTFQSVILAGVYDIKNLKLKLRPEDLHQYNSPWNIAMPFDTDMSLPADGIAGMLNDYKADHHLCFDEQPVAQLIYDYTSGYPFLVSRLCQIIDEEEYSWDKEGVLKAVNKLLSERNVLFDDIVKKIDQFPELKQTLKGILYSGQKYTYSPYEKYLQLGVMFSFLKNNDGVVSISCRLIETMLYTLFISEEKQSAIYGLGETDKSQFIHDGYIDMRHLLERFCVHFNEI